LKSAKFLWKSFIPKDLNMDTFFDGASFSLIVIPQLLVVIAVGYWSLIGQSVKGGAGQRPERIVTKRTFASFTTILLLVVVAEVHADPVGQESTISDATDQISAGGASGDSHVNSAQRSVEAIAAWLTTEFGLPASNQYPRIELVSPERMAILRYAGSPQALDPSKLPPNGLAALSQDTVAIYMDAERTIYLSTAWTGDSPADLSVLVHEMVHHQQNLAGEKFECHQEREKLAYAAQERWLNRFGQSLEADFELDGFSLLAKTRCLY
jgi:hypothetical protein